MIFATGDGAGPESIYKWWLSGLLILVLSLGCAIPTSRKRVIPERIAVSPETLVEKLDLLTPGMELRETFSFLQIEPKTPGVREIVTAEEKQRILYGAAQLVGSPDEMERFRHRLAKHRHSGNQADRFGKRFDVRFTGFRTQDTKRPKFCLLFDFL
jgi:hypothetical protein